MTSIFVIYQYNDTINSSFNWNVLITCFQTGNRYRIKYSTNYVLYILQKCNVTIHAVSKTDSSKCQTSEANTSSGPWQRITAIQATFCGEMPPDFVDMMDSGQVCIGCIWNKICIKIKSKKLQFKSPDYLSPLHVFECPAPKCIVYNKKLTFFIVKWAPFLSKNLKEKKCRNVKKWKANIKTFSKDLFFLWQQRRPHFWFPFFFWH